MKSSFVFYALKVIEVEVVYCSKLGGFCVSKEHSGSFEVTVASENGEEFAKIV